MRAMRPFNSLPLVLFSLVVVGCGGPKQTAALPAKTAPAGPLRVEKPQPDLSPVSAPKDLVLVARAEHLDNAAATIARWMNLPFDMRMLDTLGSGLSQTLLADAPVEAAVTLAEGGDTEVPQPYAVFSVGVRSLDAGRVLFDKFGRKLKEATTGVWMTQEESPLTCAVAPAVGRVFNARRVRRPARGCRDAAPVRYPRSTTAGHGYVRCSYRSTVGANP